MMGFGGHGLSRLLGAEGGGGIQIIEPDRAPSWARRRAAAAMCVAMLKGDVETVVAALTMLGVPTPPRDIRQA